MALEISRDGQFALTIDSSSLSRGLRPSKRLPRNNQFLTENIGLVGRDGVLQALDEITRIATATITDLFPFPQIFVFINVIIVCSQNVIYEWVAGSLVPKTIYEWVAGVLVPISLTRGSTWSAIDFYDYILLTNGRVGVYRDSNSKLYILGSNYSSSVCNFNGQVFIGAPNVDAPGIDLSVLADPGIANAVAYGELV